MKENRLRTALAGGRIAVGHMISEFATRGVARIVEAAGVDFVVVDMEHTAFGAPQIADLMAWFRGTTVTPLVRVPQRQYHFLARTMDAGAMGVMVANVESGAEAREIVGAVKYAPMGHRGVGLGVAHTDYVQPDAVAYFAESNAATTVICQIESTRGLDKLDEIAAVEGVDVLWVGHFDLSQSMGIPAQFHHLEFLAALRRVVEAARRRGRAAGIQPGSAEQAAEWRAIGYNVISWSNDISVYRNALAAAVGSLRT
jgi:2-keto-3-deoxy-L-rhamnonate aldolase RhmA